jgi:hypothetical protein
MIQWTSEKIKSWRDFCYEQVKNWKNSPEFLARIDKDWEKAFSKKREKDIKGDP